MTSTKCRHQADPALCIVAECRADGLVEVIRDLIVIGSPHEHILCPEDDTCECELAARINAVLAQDKARKEYQQSQER